MAWTGSCNRCGHCGCNSMGETNIWSPGISGNLMDWGRQYPEEELNICSLIKGKFLADNGYEWGKDDYAFTVTIRIVGGGSPIDITCYITKEGLQKSVSDTSCPFYDAVTPECLLYGRSAMPYFCQNAPDNMGAKWDDEHAAQWAVNHPHTSQGGTCGYLWTS